ncbi:uncharacterized protein LOC128207635 isoform X2 [Mya arenaria]|uniref:uncharacterized protein LOC128207635 isoform X2 n=1 Tax=Mya arenaria TaxID=6604 RepID=UPI0022E27EDC|nr:uncharacterized protein LOC128207635 isoform X2 [Mya arenaria]XP_052766637.1 uncharacterized protein LOC128207635 isoform X2 [Mya arenaria]
MWFLFFENLTEKLYFVDWIDTRDQRAYRYCSRRTQTAISKCSENAHDQNKPSIYQGKIEVYASKRCFLKGLFKTASVFKHTTISDIQKHGSCDCPVVLIVSSSEQEKIEDFCANIRRDQENKLVCALIVTENGHIEKPVVHKRKFGFCQQCSDTDQISCCVDDLLERLIFRFYEDVLKSHFYSMSKGEEHCLEQAKENDEILREAVALHAKFEIPLPEWLEPQAQSVTDICDICDDKYLLNELDPVFRKLDQMPFVFDIVPEAKHIAVKVLKAKTEKETTQQVDAVKRECKIKADLFKIKMITFNKCTKYKYESGNELTVENRTGTLSGFAKMKQLETEKMVAILAGHVADDKKSKHFDTTLKIQKETVGEIRPRATNLEGFSDISIADISKEISQHCDKKFKNEDNERFIAVPLQTDSGEQKKSRFERVHIWGAKSKPGTAQVKEYGIPRPDATGLIYIAKEPHASIETYWKEGDSGAMVLSERYRREKDQHLIAIGLFIGQSIEDDGTKYVVFSLQSGFDHLSKDYDARFKLYKDESNEEEDD